MHSKHCLLALLLLMVASTAVAQTSSLVQAVKPPENLNFCGESVPLELDDVTERFEKEMLLILWDQPQVLLWLKRTTRYFPWIAQQLSERQMPQDICFLPIVESALRPDAGSSKGAVGLWQLMPATARNHGLRVDDQIDERRDLVLSTQAALCYLQELHDQFGSWTLAMAAYNMGEDGLGTEILVQNTSNYYKLFLPMETQRFVFRILAAKLVVGNPVYYGVQIGAEAYYAPVMADTVSLACSQETPISLVAEAAGTYFKMIKDLNPKLRTHYLPIGQHQIYLPSGSGAGFNQRLEKLTAEQTDIRQQRTYVVQNGDSLSAIAKKFNVPLGAIKIWNRMDIHKTLFPGERLVIHPSQTKPTEP